MELLEIESEQQMRREELASQLRDLADMLERHNGIDFTREGVRYSVKVADQVTVEYELEITDSGGELEIEVSW